VVGAAAALAMALAGEPLVARADVRVNFDKTYPFARAQTWAWSADSPGDVIAARSADDDPKLIRKQAEPIILETVTAELAKRKLSMTTGEPDLRVTYYLVLTIDFSAQMMGQFLPPTMGWDVAPFSPSTQSLEINDAGVLVLDLAADKMVVWRGIARAQIRTDTEQKRRENMLRDAIRDMLDRYPKR
jgi:hypothetical protein